MNEKPRKINRWKLFALLLVGFLLAAIVVASVMPDFTDEEVDEMFEDVVEEITTYTMVKDKMGKYSGEYPNETITQIAILITPLVSVEINMMGMSIKLDTGENVMILDYTGNASLSGTEDMFLNSVWDNLTTDEYGFIVINDEDNSLIEYDLINDNDDLVYVIFKLGENLAMSYKDTMAITMFPSTGWQKTIHAEAAVPITSIVDL